MKRRNPLLWIGSLMVAVVVLAAALAGAISKHGPTEQLYRDLALTPPSWTHWVGVDGVGRDVLTRMLYGARATLGIALGATAIAVLMGSILGATAGTFRIAPWLCIAPGMAITWTVLAFNLLSDGLRRHRR
jgi:peptide/nickel transport system permease protein